MNPKIEKRFQNVARSTTFQNIIKTFGLDKKEVLDLGCSNGEFLIHFGKGSVGITVSPEEVEYGKVKGLDIRYGNAETPLELGKKFDVIFANNLFEHLYAPHAFLQTIKPYLKDDGFLILGVPCVPKITPLLHVGKFRGSLAGAHINFFIRDTLRLTVERGGWIVRAVRGFHIFNPLLDKLLDPVYPHFYVIAKPDPHFGYSEKRQKELRGYENVDIPSGH